ncbi:unnamed protein product, partial [Didymodactylos carnosus]
MYDPKMNLAFFIEILRKLFNANLFGMDDNINRLNRFYTIVGLLVVQNDHYDERADHIRSSIRYRHPFYHHSEQLKRHLYELMWVDIHQSPPIAETSTLEVTPSASITFDYPTTPDEQPHRHKATNFQMPDSRLGKIRSVLGVCFGHLWSNFKIGNNNFKALTKCIIPLNAINENNFVI